MTHSLLEETTPANGEVSFYAASSIALCTLLTWARVLPDAPALDDLDAPPVISSVWCFDAVLVCSNAKIANDAITIAQTTSEASRIKRTIEETTPLDYVPAWMS
ncbi:MAG TPA: hypothetical protein VGX72_04600 [Solirubrobacteraceae bacterium]|nr:hypothetical protein [Solirubrobacteraceae bacterium]